MASVRRLLNSIANGDSAAAEQLLPLVYDELRKLAESKLAKEQPGQTLQATALVHEAYLRLVGSSSVQDQPTWESRGHFFASAALAMRRILVESARRKKRNRRGGGLQRADIEIEHIAKVTPHEDVVRLDLALDKLACVDRTAAELVQLRYFAGLSNADSASILGISARTADRRWAFARAWLRTELSDSGFDDS